PGRDPVGRLLWRQKESEWQIDEIGAGLRGEAGFGLLDGTRDEPERNGRRDAGGRPENRHHVLDASVCRAHEDADRPSLEQSFELDYFRWNRHHRHTWCRTPTIPRSCRRTSMPWRRSEERRAGIDRST